MARSLRVLLQKTSERRDKRAAALFAYWIYPSLRDLDAAVPMFVDIRVDLALVAILPALIATLAMGFLGWLMAGWRAARAS